MPPKSIFLDLSYMRSSEFQEMNAVAMEEIRMSEIFYPFYDGAPMDIKREKEWFEKYSMETFRVEKDKVWETDGDILSK
jgi:hypothetical protein